MKRAFMDGYKTYNPNVEGYGDSRQWRGAFRARMGLSEATRVLGKKDPRTTLGVGASAGFIECRSAYRKLVREFHPDNQVTGNAAKFRTIQAAWEVLEDRFQKGGGK
jgi:DnaJ-domain-containing protein 1